MWRAVLCCDVSKDVVCTSVGVGQSVVFVSRSVVSQSVGRQIVVS